MGKEAVTAKIPVIEVPAKQEGIFDHRTHIRDANTGRMVAYQPYATHSFGDTKLLERPPGSGNMFSPSGDPVGRWVTSKTNPGHFEQTAQTHTPTAPQALTREAAIEQANEALQEENEALQAELAAMKAAAAPKEASKAPEHTKKN